MNIPLYKGEGQRTECKNYKSISLLNVVGKIYAVISVDRVLRVNVGLIDHDEEDFEAGRECADQIFNLKQIGEKA